MKSKKLEICDSNQESIGNLDCFKSISKLVIQNQQEFQSLGPKLCLKIGKLSNFS